MRNTVARRMSQSASGLSSGMSGELPYRSEEHTSELQSRSDLVCRLLLEKKKTEETEYTGHNHGAAYEHVLALHQQLVPERRNDHQYVKQRAKQSIPHINTMHPQQSYTH